MLRTVRFRNRLLVLMGLLALNLLILTGAGFAQDRDDSNPRDARNTIERTNSVMADAQDAVRRHQVYTGDLASAYSHEDYARELYRKNQFHNAIEHSLYARRLA